MKKQGNKKKPCKKPSKESKSSNIDDDDLASIIRSDLGSEFEDDSKPKRSNALEDIKKKRSQKGKDKVEKQIVIQTEAHTEPADVKTKIKRKRLKRLHKDTNYSDSE